MNLAEDLPVEFAEPLARAAARLHPFGRQIVWYADVSSTSDVAASLAEHGAEEGLVVVANAQSAGRGRLGRTWASPPGAGLYVSLVLRPTRHVMPLVTIAAGVAVAQGIEGATGLRPHLKWPNDVCVGPRKLAGVLAEAHTSGGAGPLCGSLGETGRDPHSGPWRAERARRDWQPAEGSGGTSRAEPLAGYVVLGFGINVMPAVFPPDTAPRASSLEAELSRSVDRPLLFVECLAAFAQRYHELACGRAADVIAAWRERAAMTLGRKVQLEAGGARHEGVAEDVDETGALLVRTPVATIRVTSGEVIWL